MPAIPKHRTDTVDRPWDAAENVKRLRSGEKESYYHKMFAWQDPDADPETKGAYKFPHHEVDADGDPGPANLRGCIAGIAVLNGAMGGADIPDKDRKGVWSHLAAHMEDAGMEPAELKKYRLFSEPREFRMMNVTALPIEEREDGGPPEMVVEGYAIRFNEPAVFDVFGTEYKEVIVPEAIEDADMSDVPLKYNHSDDVMIMARTRNKTLELIPDEQGLKIRARLANTNAGRDLYELIRRGDIDKMSFAFTVREDSYDRKTRTRTIRKIKKIWDVSAVDTPAYESTSLYARSWAEAEAEAERNALERAELRKRLILRTYL